MKPKKWEDPFENFILRSRLQLPTGEHATIGFREKFYGQCWTLQRASDAIWRIYSPRSDAVPIRSTVRKLAESLSRCRGDWARVEVFIGRVRFLSNPKLMAFAKRLFRSEGRLLSMRTFANTLLVKRPAFKHEREVRLLFISHDDTEANGDLFSYPVNPKELIDQVMIDPRMAESAANALKQKIKSDTGFPGEIKRSLLYSPPPTLVISL